MNIFGIEIPLGPWATTLQGFLILLALAVIGYLFTQMYKHLVANVQARRKEKDVQNLTLAARVATLEFRIESLSLDVQEYRVDGAWDRAAKSSLRAMYVEIRALINRLIGGARRSQPPELAELDTRYSDWRRADHDENDRRGARDLQRLVAERNRLQVKTDLYAADQAKEE